MSYSRLSIIWANTIAAESKINEEQRQVVAYAIENIFLTVFGFALILIVGSLFRAVLPTTLAAIAGGLLRRFSGGAHAKTATRCLIIGALSYGIIGIAAKHLVVYLPVKPFIFFIYLICLVMVLCYAPVDCQAKRIHSRILRKKLKAGSIGFILILMLSLLLLPSPVMNTALALGALYQSMTLLPILNEGGELNA